MELIRGGVLKRLPVLQDFGNRELAAIDRQSVVAWIEQDGEWHRGGRRAIKERFLEFVNELGRALVGRAPWKAEFRLVDEIVSRSEITGRSFEAVDRECEHFELRGANRGGVLRDFLERRFAVVADAGPEDQEARLPIGGERLELGRLVAISEDREGHSGWQNDTKAAIVV